MNFQTAMKWIKRVVFSTLGIIAIAFLVFGSRPGNAGVPADFVVVEYWEKWIGNEASQMRQIVDDFNGSVGLEKKIYVRYMSMTAVDQKTLVATSAGVPPDVAGLWDQQVSQYAALGAAEPLDDLAAAHGITAQSYLPVFWNGCHYNGHLYGLVSTPGTIALIYNKQIFHDSAGKLRAAGLDPDRPPRTLAELDRYAAALDTKDEQGQLDRAGYLPLQSWYVAFYAYWFGGNIFDPVAHKFTIDSPEMIDTYRWIQSYSKRLGQRALMDLQNSLGNFDSPQNPFLVGKLVMEQQGPWMANYIAHLNPAMSEVLAPTAEEWRLAHRTDNYAWGVAAFPSAAPGLEDVSYNSFDVLMIPKGARHKKEAFEFIAYVNRQDVSEKLNMLHCKNCQLRNVSRNFLENHANPFIGVYQALAASANAHGVPPVPIWPEVFKELSDTAQSVALEGTDPATVLHTAQLRMQERYDRFHQIEQERQRLGIN
jgi:ABC-type glycerol-3-phosphate transport system substrate-binding protein